MCVLSGQDRKGPFAGTQQQGAAATLANIDRASLSVCCHAVPCFAVLCWALQLLSSPELQDAAAAVHKVMGLFASVLLPNVVVSSPQGKSGPEAQRVLSPCV